jgi:hypothetical protein
MSMNPLRRHSQDAAASVESTTRTDGHDTVRHETVRDDAGRVRDEVRTERHERPDGAARADRDLSDRDLSDRDLSDRDLRDRDLADRDRDRDLADRDRDRGTPRTHVLDRDRDRDGLPDVPDADQPLATDRASVVAREKEAFGGVKFGSAFFGWLTAVGTAVLLTALVAAVTTAVRVAGGDEVTTDPATIVAGTGLRTDVAIIAILFIAYYCGGYVAGRMARFNGVKQGLAVWAWAIVAALLITAVGAIAGARWDLLGSLNGFPRLQVDDDTVVTGAGVLTTLIALAAALAGAVLGGLAGMRFHRRVDRAGLGR